MLKHYVEFYFAGAFVSDTSTRQVRSRDEVPVLPRGAYAYRFFDREEAVTNDGEVLVGQPKNRSPMTVFGEEWPLARVEREMPGEATLLANMRGNGWKRVAECRQGFISLADSDVVRPLSEAVFSEL